MKRTNNPTVHAISLDDLVFANRNKEYGAYMLRRLYTRHISFALAVSVLIFAVFSILSLKLNHQTIENFRTDDGVKTGVITFDSPIINKPIVETGTLCKPQGPVKSTVKFMQPVVTNDPADGSQSIPTATELKNATPGYTTQTGDPKGNDNPIDVVRPAQPVTPPVEIKDDVIEFSEKMPAYEGGESELFTFMGRNIHYPELAVKAGVEGKVLVQFIVEKDGSLSNVQVVKGIGAGCDEEAVRVCRLMSGWHPGFQNGKAVRVRIIIPFMFKLR